MKVSAVSRRLEARYHNVRRLEACYHVRRAWRGATCMVHVVREPVRETEPGSDLEVRVLRRP